MALYQGLMEHAVANLVHLAASDAAARADAMYQLVLVASAHESALQQLAGPLCIERLTGIAESAGGGAPEVAAFVAWIFAKMADSQTVRLASDAPEVLDCLARLLPSANDRVRAASSRAVQALADGSPEGMSLVVDRAGRDAAFLAELGLHSRLQPLVAVAVAAAARTAAAVPTTPVGAPPQSAAAASAPAVSAAAVSATAGASSPAQQLQGTVLRVDGELVLVVTANGPKATTVSEVLRRSVVRRITELEPVARATMSAADRATATSELNVAFSSYLEADNMAQMAMEQITDQCDALDDELIHSTESGESTDPELTAESQSVRKSLAKVAQCRVTQLPKHRVQGAATIQYLEQLAHKAKAAADEAEAFVVNSVDEAGYDFGFDIDDAPMDLSQLGEAATRLERALKKTGAIIHVGCRVRPAVPVKPTQSQTPSPQAGVKA